MIETCSICGETFITEANMFVYQHRPSEEYYAHVECHNKLQNKGIKMKHTFFGNNTCELCGTTYNPIHSHECTPVEQYKPKPLDTTDFMKRMEEYHKSCAFCPSCGNKHEDHKIRILAELCFVCIAKNKQKEKEDAIAKSIEGLDIYERIARIESILYDHFKNHVQRESIFR